MYSYADNVVPNKGREEFMYNQVHLWLKPFVDEINEQNGIVDIYLNKLEKNHLSFSGINDDLDGRIIAHLKTIHGLRNPDR